MFGPCIISQQHLVHKVAIDKRRTLRDDHGLWIDVSHQRHYTYSVHFLLKKLCWANDVHADKMVFIFQHLNAGDEYLAKLFLKISADASNTATFAESILAKYGDRIVKLKAFGVASDGQTIGRILADTTKAKNPKIISSIKVEAIFEPPMNSKFMFFFLHPDFT